MAELIPRRVLFGNPERSNAVLSPNGARVAFTAPRDGVMNLYIFDVDGGSVAGALPITNDRDRGIRSYLWSRDSRYLLYLQDQGGDENWRLHRVDVDTGEDRDLTPFGGVQARPAGSSPRHPGELLVALNRRDPKWHDVYHLDVATGELTLAVENNIKAAGFVADAELVVRAASRARPDGGSEVLARDNPDDEWTVLAEADFGDGVSPMQFSADGCALYCRSSVGANTSRLVRFDIGNGESSVVIDDPEYDVGTVLFHPERREPQAVTFMKERIEYAVLDPSIEDDVAVLGSIGRGDPIVRSRDDADRRWLVSLSTDSGPTTYHLYERVSRTSRHLFTTQPELEGYELAPMEPFEFAASDGLLVRGYLTFPVNAPRADLPAVVYVHGGPWARDSWGYNPTAQWIANRGYVCIQVNYRGSTGYGKAFLNAGNKEWGGKMHTDLVDAVAFVVAQGWVDRERVAIYGGSYGGYAALCGATFTPDVFRCAVDLVGPSSIKTLIDSVPPYWVDVARQFRMRAGDPDSEPEFVEAGSPLTKAHEIKIPLLIAQGANDPRVKRSESEQIVAALEANGIPHRYMLFEDEGHGFVKPENQDRFHHAVEEFLAEHLGGRAETR